MLPILKRDRFDAEFQGSVKLKYLVNIG